MSKNTITLRKDWQMNEYPGARLGFSQYTINRIASAKKGDQYFQLCAVRSAIRADKSRSLRLMILEGITVPIIKHNTASVQCMAGAERTAIEKLLMECPANRLGLPWKVTTHDQFTFDIQGNPVFAK